MRSRRRRIPSARWQAHHWVKQREGGHFGGDDRLRDMLFKSGLKDPLGQRAGAEAGVLSLLTGVAALTAFAPQSNAQGIAVDTPVGGVRIGEPGYRHHYRDYDRPYVRERRIYRDREVGLGGGCRTVTITRDDGSYKRIGRCD